MPSEILGEIMCVSIALGSGLAMFVAMPPLGSDCHSVGSAVNGLSENEHICLPTASEDAPQIVAQSKSPGGWNGTSYTACTSKVSYSNGTTIQGAC